LFVNLSHVIAFLFDVKNYDSPPNSNFATWARYLEYVTHLPYLSDEWRAEHRKFIGASLVGTILDLNHNKSRRVLWRECREPPAEVTNEFSEFIKNRGLTMEKVLTEIYKRLCLAPGETFEESHSMVDPSLKMIMATPDGAVRNAAGKIVRNIEFKNPIKRHAYLDVPDEYMAQIQVTMRVSGVHTCDFVSLEVNDATLASVLIVHRVQYHEQYVTDAMLYVTEFCCQVWADVVPSMRCPFAPHSYDIQTEQILHIENPIHMIPMGVDMTRKAISDARAAAHASMATIPLVRLTPTTTTTEPAQKRPNLMSQAEVENTYF
jgi:hypothetical protein